MSMSIKSIGGSATIVLEQEADSNSDKDTQYLEVTVKDAGGGAYLVFNTTEWAVNDGEELKLKLDEILQSTRKLVEGD